MLFRSVLERVESRDRGSHRPWISCPGLRLGADRRPSRRAGERHTGIFLEDINLAVDFPDFRALSVRDQRIDAQAGRRGGPRLCGAGLSPRPPGRDRPERGQLRAEIVGV